MRLSDAYKPNELLKQSRFILGLQFAMILAILGAVAYCGAWHFLWFIPTVFPISVLCNLIRPIYWRGFDPYIWRAAEEGRYGTMVGWNILTAMLDWIFNAIPASLGAYIVCCLAERQVASYPLRADYRPVRFGLRYDYERQRSRTRQGKRRA